MAMTPAAVRLMFAGLILSAACAGEDLQPPPVGNDFGDGGFGGRPVADGGGDAQTRSDATDAPVAQLPEGAMVDVVVAAPAADAIIPRADIFKPEIQVVVTGKTTADLPSIENVSVMLAAGNELQPRAPVQLALKAMMQTADPASRSLTYGNVAVPIDDLKSGEIVLTATARLLGGKELVTKTKFKIDAGPAIEFVQPMAADLSFKSAVRFEVSIADAVFAPIKDVQMFLGTEALTLEPGADGTHVANINFASFNPPLSGEQLVTVRARNANGTLTVVSRRFLADDQGPAFTMLKPSKGQLVGGIIEIAAVLNDPAGVKPDSVVAVIANGSAARFEVRLDPPPVGAPTQLYTKLFDAKQLPDNAIFPTISFRAADKLGNESSEGYLLSFDKTPPLLDLDPPDDLRFLVEFQNRVKCSWPTDPVGPDAVDDGQLVNQAFDVRVRAEDQGNNVLSGSIDFVPIGGLKKVELLVLDDTARPLVVDTDADGSCDAVNPTLVPTTRPMNANDVLLLNLEALTAAGTPDNFPESPAPACETGGLGEPVKPICGEMGPTYNPWKMKFSPGSDLPHGHFMSVFPYYTQGRLPSLWTLGPVKDGVECAGRQLEAVGSNLNDGWICLAAVGEDTLGQKQVSRPIRVCVDKDGDGKECPHVEVERVSDTSPVMIKTKKPHGLATGDEVFLQGILCQTQVNGRHKVTINDTDPLSFSIQGSVGRTDLGTCAPTPAYPAWVVPFKAMPDCTGKQTQKENPPKVDATPCTPWRSYARGQFRTFK